MRRSVLNPLLERGARRAGGVSSAERGPGLSSVALAQRKGGVCRVEPLNGVVPGRSGFVPDLRLNC